MNRIVTHSCMAAFEHDMARDQRRRIGLWFKSDLGTLGTTQISAPGTQATANTGRALTSRPVPHGVVAVAGTGTAATTSGRRKVTEANR